MPTSVASRQLAPVARVLPTLIAVTYHLLKGITCELASETSLMIRSASDFAAPLKRTPM